MHRKPGFPAANCNIKLPDGTCSSEASLTNHGIEEDCQRRRQQLINYAHSIWGFNNWSWSVTKQDLDFIDDTNGKYTAGVVAFVSITVKTFDIHREDIGYATSVALMKGLAIYKARKSAVTNALKETLLSFGGSVASELTQQLEAENESYPSKGEELAVNQQENNQNVANEPAIVHRRADGGFRKDSSDSSSSSSKDGPLPSAPPGPTSQRSPVALGAPVLRNTGVVNQPTHAVKPQPPAAGGHPANRAPRPSAPPVPPANQPLPHSVPQLPAHHLRTNSNVSFVLQPVLPGVVPPLYSVQCAAATPPARVPPAHIFPNPYYGDCAPFRFTYEGFDRHHANVNLNFNIPPKNLVVSGRAGAAECDSACGAAERVGTAGVGSGAWIKPTIFYDGFWTEQKVKKWVSEQCERPLPEEPVHETAHNHSKM